MLCSLSLIIIVIIFEWGKELVRFHRIFSKEEYLVLSSYEYQKKILVYISPSGFMGDETEVIIIHKADFFDKHLKTIIIQESLLANANIGCYCDMFTVNWIDENSFYLLIGANKERFLIKVD
jgi:hypothetical protein